MGLSDHRPDHNSDHSLITSVKSEPLFPNRAYFIGFQSHLQYAIGNIEQLIILRMGLSARNWLAAAEEYNIHKVSDTQGCPDGDNPEQYAEVVTHSDARD